MKTKLLISAIFLIAFIFSGCQKSNNEIQEDVTSMQKKKPVERPFKITGNTVVIGGGEECGLPPDVGSTVEYMGEGNARHMGHVTYTGTNCMLGECLDSEITVIAANGDELYLVSTDYAICETTDSEYPIVTYKGPGTINGGTGRFFGATGSIDWIVVVNFANGTATMEAEGTITY